MLIEIINRERINVISRCDNWGSVMLEQYKSAKGKLWRRKVKIEDITEKLLREIIKIKKKYSSRDVGLSKSGTVQ